MHHFKRKGLYYAHKPTKVAALQIDTLYHSRFQSRQKC